MNPEFDVPKIRASVLELSAKTKEKKRLRRQFLDLWRQDRSNHGARELFLEQHVKAKYRGDCARYWGLVYAFVRGMPYRRVERKTHARNKPKVLTMLGLLTESFKQEPVPFEREKRVRELEERMCAWLAESAEALEAA